jgi:hypothetical protein
MSVVVWTGLWCRCLVCYRSISYGDSKCSSSIDASRKSKTGRYVQAGGGRECRQAGGGLTWLS